MLFSKVIKKQIGEKRAPTCSLAGADTPILRRNDRNISSSIAVSFSSVRGTIGTDTVVSVQKKTTTTQVSYSVQKKSSGKVHCNSSNKLRNINQ